MVAALLDDETAIEILLSIKGVDPHLESPIFKRTYQTIRGISRGAISSLQNHSGSGPVSGGRSSGGTSGGRSGGSGSTGPSIRNVPEKYRGFTSLMIAVAENNCELVDSLIEIEPETLNYRTSRGATALSVSIYHHNKCLLNLLKAGAFDLNLFKERRNYIHDISQTVEFVEEIESSLDFIKYVDESVFESKEFKEALPEILVFSDLDLELKIELNKKSPISLEELKRLLSSHERAPYRLRNLFWSAPFIETDLHYLNHIGFDLRREKVFGEGEDQTFLSAVLTKVHVRWSHYDNDRYRVERRLGLILSEVAEANPKWVLDWVNSPNSFKGQNPLVAASMFNEEGIVNALLEIEGIDVNVVDAKTGYNAFEWQYVTNPFMWHFSWSDIAKALADKGASVRSEKANLIGKPNRAAKADMEKKRRDVDYPFNRESRTTKKTE